MTATTWPFIPAMARPREMPAARPTDVEVWPRTKGSCSDSEGLEKPETSS